MKNWYCVRTKLRQERVALERLQVELGVECFLPMVARVRRGTRVGRESSEALFPGYLFVAVDLATEHRKVGYASGVLGFVRMGDRFPSLTDAEIEGLRKLCEEVEDAARAEATIQAGDAVELVGRLFGGTKGTVLQLMPAKNRVRVLIEFLSRSVEVDVPADAVQRAPEVGGLQD